MEKCSVEIWIYSQLPGAANKERSIEEFQKMDTSEAEHHHKIFPKIIPSSFWVNDSMMVLSLSATICACVIAAWPLRCRQREDVLPPTRPIRSCTLFHVLHLPSLKSQNQGVQWRTMRSSGLVERYWWKEWSPKWLHWGDWPLQLYPQWNLEKSAYSLSPWDLWGCLLWRCLLWNNIILFGGRWKGKQEEQVKSRMFYTRASKDNNLFHEYTWL